MRLSSFMLGKYLALKKIHEEGALVDKTIEELKLKFPADIEWPEPRIDSWNYGVSATVHTKATSLEEVMFPGAYVSAGWMEEEEGIEPGSIIPAHIRAEIIYKHEESAMLGPLPITLCQIFTYPLNAEDIYTLVSLGKIYIEHKSATDVSVLCRVD